MRAVGHLWLEDLFESAGQVIFIIHVIDNIEVVRIRRLIDDYPVFLAVGAVGVSDIVVILIEDTDDSI